VREGSHIQRRDALVAASLYAALTLVLTWPLARGLTRDIPSDFGDPLFASWAIAWDATHLGRGWWKANIFHPHPLSLAYSEHFLAQGLQILPIYAATRNPILCYNLLFLSTFVLSGVGAFLLGRELTGSRAAGFVAGLAYAFAPYRFAALAHLQLLSAGWMPLVLFGLRRHFVTGRARPLAGAAAAWLAQNLSCGYYFLFFSPVVVLYMVWEIVTRGLWRNARSLMSITSACGAVALATVPFLLPYVELRRLGFSPRSIVETVRFSADTYAYLTADPSLRLAGALMRAWPRAEGVLFPGFAIVALAAIGVCASWLAARRGSPARFGRRDRIFAWLLAASIVLVIAMMFGWTVRLSMLKITSVTRLFWVVAAFTTAWLAISPDARAMSRRWVSSPAAIFAVLAVFAILMSFGPQVHAKGRLIVEQGPYAFFYNVVPGFDGVRVPARFGMIVALCLATLAALGVRALEDARAGGASVFLAAMIIAEAWAVPMRVNDNWTTYQQGGLAPLPGTLALDAPRRDLYRAVADLSPSAAIAELPLGEPAFDIRYMFYSTTHWKRLINGYSGGEPAAYTLLAQGLQDVLTRPDRAWQRLVESRATHAIVHESMYAGDRGARVSDWLREHGAREIGSFGGSRLFELP
jgi:hypothetical protein